MLPAECTQTQYLGHFDASTAQLIGPDPSCSGWGPSALRKADGPHPNPSPKGEGLESPAISHIHALTLASSAKSAKAARALKPAHNRTASWQMLPSSDRNGAQRTGQSRVGKEGVSTGK